MLDFIFITGTSGVGKSTLCKIYWINSAVL